MSHIKARGLSIDFPLYHLGARSLKKRLLASARVRLRRDEAAHEMNAHTTDRVTRRVGGEVVEDAAHRVVVSALRDLTFEIRKGERVGLVGHNGAGKTTLLRTLAGVFEPVGGFLEVSGEVGSLIDATAGLDVESTGRENIRLAGLFRGLDAAGIARLEEEAGSFSGLAEFLDVPIKGYSSGMQLRLAFALMTASSPNIILMDEWFLAGDTAFMEKAEARLTALVGGADIVVLASHDMAVIRRWCDRAIWLEAGRIRADGPVEEVLAARDAAS
ncbi:MAG: ABC transporter ATP-binding protein [Acetobacteraceae bacterium]|nr:ABC transporter ATP-binding protein [Acetobacteraceae bacterium]